MQIIPFLRKSYKSKLSPQVILERFKKKTIEPSWRLEVDRLTGEDAAYEGKTSEMAFILGRKRYSLTYTNTSFFPITKGKLKYNKSDGTTIVEVTCMLSWGAIVILSFFYFIVVTGFIVGIRQNIPSTSFGLAIFFVTTYSLIITIFNVWRKRHLVFIEKIL